jgi:molybdopterin-containing oxidoreductase family membrane subunit
MNVHVLGVFDAAGKAADAARRLRTDGFARVTTYAPAFDHNLDAALGPGKSPVRAFTLAGGILGCALGFAFPIYTVLDWPLITGGKAIVSLPPFVVIAFELTIFFAALMTVAGFLLSSGLPRLRQAPYDARFSQDRWGVLVTCAAERAEAARAHLTQADVEEVRVGEGTR